MCAEDVWPILKSRTSSKSSTDEDASMKAPSKRLLSNACFEQLLDDDLRIEAKKSKV